VTAGTLTAGTWRACTTSRSCSGPRSTWAATGSARASTATSPTTCPSRSARCARLLPAPPAHRPELGRPPGPTRAVARRSGGVDPGVPPGRAVPECPDPAGPGPVPRHQQRAASGSRPDLHHPRPPGAYRPGLVRRSGTPRRQHRPLRSPSRPRPGLPRRIGSAGQVPGISPVPSHPGVLRPRRIPSVPGPDEPHPAGPSRPAGPNRPAGLCSPARAGRGPRCNRLDAPTFRSWPARCSIVPVRSHGRPPGRRSAYEAATARWGDSCVSER
jgi:hypothetical protein